MTMIIINTDDDDVKDTAARLLSGLQRGTVDRRLVMVQFMRAFFVYTLILKQLQTFLLNAVFVLFCVGEVTC
jgi:hypothetical protein